MRQSLRFAAQFIIRLAIISTPVCALITTAAVSTASSAPIDWPMKSGKPGVSMRWVRVFAWSRWTIAERRLCRYCFSIGSKSQTVEPRSTVPAAWIMPAVFSSASVSVVLPDAP